MPGTISRLSLEITARLERERMLNARLEKDIQHRKEQASFLRPKRRPYARRCAQNERKDRELEEDVVEVRQEDRTIRKFTIPCQEELSGHLLELTSVSFMRDGKPSGEKSEDRAERAE